jgi:hypothetical protein
LIGLASIGLPGTNGFVGEFLILLGAFKAHWVYGAIAVTGVIFGAAYLLWYYERAILGPVGRSVRESVGDLHLRETVIAVALSVMILWIGLYPAPFLRMMNGSVQALVDRIDHGRVATAGASWPEARGEGQEVKVITGREWPGASGERREASGAEQEGRGGHAKGNESEALPLAARLAPLATDGR